ncbi:hypothetical protein PR001_g6864 [Phytophthora rubi]|uniref:Uncharacterized protein n=1 Tax=Phytophthora rubi TaxID=129364 RepID=A0A6A3NHY8_9STRA|nr:hypothetical protein PR001_g6864 [Phytophthora rubi]
MPKMMTPPQGILKVCNLEAPEDGLLVILYQSDNIDIPVTISYCMGEWRPMQSNSLTACSKYALREIISYGDAIVSNWKREKDITNLKIALESNSTCGFDMKRLLDHTWLTVAELRRQNPGISEDDIRVIMSKSNLVTSPSPPATA